MSSYSDRLHRVIPGGAHTYSRGDDQFPTNAPQILQRGEGAYVWSPDGKRFLDYGMALRAVTLGYAHPTVNEAAIREIRLGNNLTRASVTELQAAELMVDLIPSADMVKFAKNGSNVTTAATKIARAYTGRRYVCVPRQHPFFSFDDWFIGTTALTRGIPSEHVSATLVFDYGNAQSLADLFAAHPGEIAAVMLEPATTLTPFSPAATRLLTQENPYATCPEEKGDFLRSVQQLCRSNGAVLIFDEMITGFRWHLQGAQAYFDVLPDITTFGKAMANGFAVAAVTGRREIMEVGAIRQAGAERTFLLSTTHGGEMAGLGALIETVRVSREQDVCRHLWNYGRLLRDGLEQAAAELGLQQHFQLDGPAINLNYLTRDREGKVSPEFRTLFAQEMIERGVLMPWIAVSLAHGDSELAMTIDAARDALRVYRDALESGVERFLRGPAIKPVFRRFN